MSGIIYLNSREVIKWDSLKIKKKCLIIGLNVWIRKLTDIHKEVIKKKQVRLKKVQSTIGNKQKNIKAKRVGNRSIQKKIIVGAIPDKATCIPMMIPTKLLREVTRIMDPKDYDRTTQNESDGQRFYGYDDKETGTNDTPDSDEW